MPLGTYFNNEVFRWVIRAMKVMRLWMTFSAKTLARDLKQSDCYSTGS